MTSYKYHYEDSVLVLATPERLFAHLDDHERLSSHMSQSSWMMGGGSMQTSFDEGKGQNVGSRIRMVGKAFGIELFLDEVVTRREPPRAKAWETVGPLKLLVIDQYRMAFEVKPEGQKTLLTVSIDYNLPKNHPLLGRLFGGGYAKWCVKQVLRDAKRAFGE